jgi:integrase
MPDELMSISRVVSIPHSADSRTVMRSLTVWRGPNLLTRFCFVTTVEAERRCWGNRIRQLREGFACTKSRARSGLLQGCKPLCRVVRGQGHASIKTKIGNHTFRATGITDYLTNGGKLEIAQKMAGHANAKTTGLYDRRNDDISVSEVERVGI